MTELKRCTKCKENKLLSCFNKDKSKKDGLSPSCKQCKKISNAKSYRKNKAKKKQYYLDNYDKIKSYREERYKKSVDTWKNSLEWIIKNKLSGYKRKDKISNRFFDLSYDEIMELLINSKGECYYCKKKYKLKGYENRCKDQWTLDRIDNDIGHCKNNCVVACYDCNAKRNKFYSSEKYKNEPKDKIKCSNCQTFRNKELYDIEFKTCRICRK